MPPPPPPASHRLFMAAAAAASAIAAYYLSFLLTIINPSFRLISFDQSVIAISAAATPAAFLVASLLPAGVRRLLALAPFFPPLLLLPRAFPASPLLRASAATSWLVLLNLLSLAFKSESESSRSSSFTFFAASLLLPIRVDKSAAAASSATLIGRHLRLFLFSSLIPASFLLFADHLPTYPYLTRLLYCLLTFISLTSFHHLSSILFLLFFRSTLLPVFDRPWRATSVTDFWSSRWNLTAHALLREAIYAPLLRLLWRRRRSSGGKPPLRARIPAVMLTFLASGLFHEITYYGMTQAEELSWEATAFFLIQGAASSLEIFLRRTRWRRKAIFRLPIGLRKAATLSFVVATAVRLLYIALDREGEMAFHVGCSIEIRRYLSGVAAGGVRRMSADEIFAHVASPPPTAASIHLIS